MRLAKAAKANTAEEAESECWTIRCYEHGFPPYPALEIFREITAFKTWRTHITPTILRNNIWAGCFAEHAMKFTERAEDQTNRASSIRFLDWLNEGPAAGLGKHHQLSRTATGWMPLRCGNDEDQPDDHEAKSNEDEAVGGLSIRSPGRFDSCLPHGPPTKPDDVDDNDALTT